MENMTKVNAIVLSGDSAIVIPVLAAVGAGAILGTIAIGTIEVSKKLKLKERIQKFKKVDKEG